MVLASVSEPSGGLGWFLAVVIRPRVNGEAGVLGRQASAATGDAAGLPV